MRKFTPLILLLIFLSGTIFAEENMILDLETAVEMALASNLGLESEKLNTIIKKRSRDTAWNYFIPRTSVSATLLRTNEAPDDISGLQEYLEIDPETGAPASGTGVYDWVVPYTVELDHTWNLAVNFNASLTLTAQMIFGIKQTFLDYEASLINLETAEKRLIRDVKKAFYNLLLLEKNLELMEKSIDSARKRYEQARINYENGLASEYTMLSAQVALENLKPGLQDMEIGYQTSLQAFKQQIGLDRRANISLQGAITMQEKSFETEELIGGSIAGRLDILSLKNTIATLENARDVSVSSLLPTLTLAFSADPTFLNDPFEDPLFDDPDEDWEQMSGMLSFTVTVPLDGLIPFSKTQVDIINANEAIRQAQIGLEQAAQGAELEIETIIMGLEKSVKSIDTLKLNVKLAEKAFRLAEDSYNAGGKELLEVQNAELELQKAQLEVITEEHNYVTGLLDLEYAINATLK